MKRSPSYFLLLLVVLLLLSSVLFFASLSAPASWNEKGNTTYYLVHQILFGFLPAILVGVAAYFVSLQFLKKWAPLFLILNMVALFLVFIPGIGSKINGASRWIKFGPAALQPSEFLKITAILYLSAWVASRLTDEEAGWRSIAKNGYHNIVYVLIPFLIFLGVVSVALILQRDASTLGIIVLTLLAIYFTAKTPFWHNVLIICIGILVLFLLVKFEPYRFDRFFVFLHPDKDPLGKAYQLKQSVISLGSGGIFGKGLGMSTQKFGFLPQAMSDSIFAVIGEELGIVGCIVLIGMYTTLFWTAIKISRQTPDRFSKMAAIGIGFWITLQAFVNMASAAGIFPLAGIPLPFFSYGGSHLVTELAGIGLLLNISKNT